MMGFFHKTPNFIEVYDNALTSNECQEIITYINSQKLVRGSLGSAQEINIEKRKIGKYQIVNLVINLK